MAIDFPTTPTVGQQYTYQGSTYVYSSQGVWVQVSNSSSIISLAVNFRKITATGSYVPSTGTQYAIFDAVGAGAGGGGATGAVGQHFTGGGGGAGALSRARLTAAQIGTALAIVIGTPGAGGIGNNPGTNGGATTIGGALITAPGGLGGQFSQVATATQIGQGGPGGAAGVVPSSDDLAAPGAPGANGAFQSGGGAVASGAGGSTIYGGGGVGVWTTTASTTGTAGSGFGSGGAGGAIANLASSATGGAGAPGVVFVTEFIATTTAASSSGSTGSNRPQGRLTLQTNVPVMTTTQAAKTTIFYTPYQGNQIPLYSGTAMVMTQFSELSILTTDVVSSPAAIGASKVNDWFVWDSGGGVLRLVHGPDWTSDTARSAGTALQMINGILTNAVAITNGPAINRGTYVGTTRSDASSQLNWVYGSSAAGGGSATFGLWNCYNRVTVSTMVLDNTDSWAYAVAAWRAANNSVAMTVQLVRGLDEDVVEAMYSNSFSASGANASVAIGLNVTNAFAGITGSVLAGTASFLAATGRYHGTPGIGRHNFNAIEYATGAATFLGDGAVSYIQTGLTATFRA